MRFSVFMMASLIGVGIAPAAFSQSMEDDHKTILSDIEGRYKQTATVARQLWDLAELGYQEEQSSKILQEELRSAGFDIQAGVADIPTAFVASYGRSGPVIAILAEFDALPGITQDAVPTRKPVAGKAAGHACGHNLFGAGSLGAALAVKAYLDRTDKPGIIRLYGTPAEEGGAGKVYMTRAGLFDDVDIALHWHAGDVNAAIGKASLANRSAKFRFRGVSAHAAGAPERGRSALDGVEAMNVMVNMMREHVHQETRIHHVITSGGSAPNVVPDFAEVFYYVRHPDPRQVRKTWAWLEQAAKGAAMGTATQVDWEIIHGSNPLLINDTLALLLDEKLREIGGIHYDDSEQVFAEQLSKSFLSTRLGLGSEKEVQPYTKGILYGSTDVGDVSYAVPTAGLTTATWVPGTAAHSWQAVAASGMSIGFKGAHNAAKVLALAAIELMENDALRAEAHAEFEASLGEGYQYQSLIGDRAPPLDYRQ